MHKFSTKPWRPDRQKYTKWELETFDMIIDAEIDELEHGVYRSAEDLEEASTAASSNRVARRKIRSSGGDRTRTATIVIVGILVFFFVLRRLVPNPEAHWKYYVVGEHTGSDGEAVPEIVAVKEDQPPPPSNSTVHESVELDPEQVSEPEFREEVTKAQVVAEVEEGGEEAPPPPPIIDQGITTVPS